MAYVLRTYASFKQFRTDVTVRVEILELDYAGEATAMILSGTPVVSRMANSGDKYTVLKGRELTINIVKQATDDYTWLASNVDRKFQVKLKLNGTLEWTGFLEVTPYEEDFSDVGIISVTASDQLGLLDSFDYTFGDPPVSPSGYEKIIVILAKALSKTGLELEIGNTVNLFEVSMYNSANSDDPFYQAEVDQDLWITDDLTPDNCANVIKDILSVFQCRVVQSAGQWWIQRIPDLSNASIPYRLFHYDGTYSAEGNYLPQIQTKRPDDAGITAFSLRSIAGGILEYDLPWKERELEVDFGLKPSLIPSYALPDSIFTQDIPAIITGWTNNAGWWRRFIPTKGNVLFANTADRSSGNVPYDVPGTGDDLYLYLPTFEATIDDTFTLSIDTGRSPKTAAIAPKCRVEVILYTGGDPNDKYNYWWYIQAKDPLAPVNIWYLQEADEWNWGVQGYLNDIEFPETDDPARLTTQTATIPVPPMNGTIIVRISAPYRGFASTSNSILYIANINLASAIDPNTDHPTGQSFVDTFSTTGSNIPESLKIRITDNFPDYYILDKYGHATLVPGSASLYLPFYRGIIKVNGAGTTKWQSSWVTPHLLHLRPTHVPPPDQIGPGAVEEGCISDSWFWQYSTSNRLFKGSFVGAIKFHNIIKFTEIDDVLFLIDDAEIDLKQGIINGTFIELKEETLGHATGDLVLKDYGIIDVGASVRRFGGNVSPSGSEGDLQFKSGSAFGASSKVNFSNDRLKVGLVDTDANPDSNPDATSTLDIVGSSGHSILRVKKL